MPDFYRDDEFFKCKDNGHVTSEKRMCHYESCGNDQKAVAADVPCGRIVYLAVAECSSRNNGNAVDRRDWMVHENKDFLFCILLSFERNDRNIAVVIGSQYGNSWNPISKSSCKK